MLSMNRYWMSVLGAVLLLSACKKDDSYQVPLTYNFENVSYTGQTQRLSMLDELKAYMLTAHVANAPALDAQRLKNMYTNSSNPFNNAELNSSGKQLKDKVASSVQNNFEVWMDSLASVSRFTNQTASNGQAGLLTKNDNSATYLFNERGMEWLQMIEKGIMGACFYYQATAVYLGESKMNVDNNTVTPGQGTAMEHHWDEAFGYWGVPLDFPGNLTGLRYWGRYTNSRNSALGLNSTMMNAFLAGRAAISNKDLAERDVQIIKIRRNWEKVCAATAISYLNQAKNNFSTDPAVKFHALSEAYAFIWSLKFGGDATITSAQVDNILIALADAADPNLANFYNTTETKINSTISTLSTYFSLDNVKDTL